MITLKYPEIKTFSDEEVDAILKRLEATQSPEDFAAIREVVEILSRFSEKDMRGKTSPEQLRAKLYGDDETETA